MRRLTATDLQPRSSAFYARRKIVLPFVVLALLLLLPPLVGLPGRVPLLDSAVPKAEAAPASATTVALSRKITARSLTAGAALSEALAPAGSGGTNVGGPITSDATWTVSGSPYVMTSPVSVAADVTLTIQPGVTVMGNAGTSLTVNGTVNAAGTAAQPIS